MALHLQPHSRLTGVRLQRAVPFRSLIPKSDSIRGLKLRLGYAIIGRTALVEDPGAIVRAQLVERTPGACQGATHYVRAALLGAFELAVEGPQQRVERGGDLAACPANAVDTPPQGCSAAVQALLGPVIGDP